MSNNIALFFIQIIIISVLLVIIIYMLKYNISIKNEKRIGKYGVDPVKNDGISIYDKVGKWYLSLVIKLRPYVSKVFKKGYKKYEKYITNPKSSTIKSIDFITHKIIISISFCLLATFAITLQNRVITLFELIIYLILGYYILDIVLNRREKNKIKKIENQILRAVIIMNNAFKAGKSTVQAVSICAEELPEPISSEFKRMYKEMKYGLSVEVVFDRFASRVDLEEVRYISSSLIILNKTGGNIVNVFNGVERTLYDRKKLKQEQKSLTTSSNMVVKVLLVLPIIFTFIIYILSPDYFSVLFNSPLGYLVLFLLVIMFVISLFLLNKILPVRVH